MPDFATTIAGLTDACSRDLIGWCSAASRKVTLLATIFAKFLMKGIGDTMVVTVPVAPRKNTSISSVSGDIGTFHLQVPEFMLQLLHFTPRAVLTTRKTAFNDTQ